MLGYVGVRRPQISLHNEIGLNYIEISLNLYFIFFF